MLLVDAIDVGLPKFFTVGGVSRSTAAYVITPLVAATAVVVATVVIALEARRATMLCVKKFERLCRSAPCLVLETSSKADEAP